jgi:hypothetical protein
VFPDNVRKSFATDKIEQVSDESGRARTKMRHRDSESAKRNRYASTGTAAVSKRLVDTRGATGCMGEFLGY